MSSAQKPDVTNLDEGDQPEDISSLEGVDVNHTSRIRVQFLVSQHASLVTQTQFADAKAAALMTLMGLVALNGPVKIGAVGRNDIDAIIIFVLMMVAIGLAIWSIIPRYPDSEMREKIRRTDRFSWPSLVAHGHEPLEYARFMRTAQVSDLVMSLARTNVATAQVLFRKFKALRAAFLLAAFDLVLIVLHVMGVELIQHG